jgi:hypothetical protein
MIHRVFSLFKEPYETFASVWLVVRRWLDSEHLGLQADQLLQQACVI